MDGVAVAALHLAEQALADERWADAIGFAEQGSPADAKRAGELIVTAKWTYRSRAGVTVSRGLCRLTSMPTMTVQTQAILAALLHDITQPQYGLEMAKAAGLPSGTIYPILARLEREGWVESEPEDIDASAAGRRPRRYYRLTGEGARVARAEIKNTVERLHPSVSHGGRRAPGRRPAQV